MPTEQILGRPSVLVADEEDSRLTMKRFEARRGEIYTAVEVQRIVVVDDPEVVAEIHEWKRRFDGVIRGGQSDGG